MLQEQKPMSSIIISIFIMHENGGIGVGTGGAVGASAPTKSLLGGGGIAPTNFSLTSHILTTITWAHSVAHAH